MPTREELTAMGFGADEVSTYKVKKTGLKRSKSDEPIPIGKGPKKQVPIHIHPNLDYGLPWEVKGGAFMCKFRKLALTDEDCMLWCKSEECRFFQRGYFRTMESGKKK
jgi:hypothetical protein